MNRSLAVLLAGGLSVLLAGCATLQTPQPAPPEQPPASAEEEIVPATEPVTAAAVPAPTPKPRPSASEQEQVAALPPPLPPGYLSSRLVGLDFDGMRAQLGEPTEIHDVAPAQEWVYKDDVCLLTVRFFPEGATLQYKALSVNVRSEISEDGNDAQCPQRFAERLRPAR